MSKILAYFLMARRPTSALMGVESFLGSMFMVAASDSVRERLFQRVDSSSSMVEGESVWAARGGNVGAGRHRGCLSFFGDRHFVVGEPREYSGWTEVLIMRKTYLIVVPNLGSGRSFEH